MSIPTTSYADVLRRALANFRTSFRSSDPSKQLPLGPKNFLGQLGRALALSEWERQKSVEDADNDIVPSSAMSSDQLTAYAINIGLPNGASGFGRLVPVAATGGQATLTGVKGTSYTDGLIATAEDGTTEVKLSGAVSISGTPPGFGSVVGAFVAVTAGAAGNLPAGTVLTWQSPPTGADGTFTLTSGLTGGADTEDDASLLKRLIAAFQNPRRGGVAQDYIEWAEGAATLAAVYVYPRRSGTGSVDLVILTGGSGTARGASASLQSAVVAALPSLRPVAVDSINVYLPYMPALNAHAVIITIKPNPAKASLAFDWIDTSGGPFTVDTYTAGSPATLKLNTLAPLSLKNAIDAGSHPRLQVMSTGSVINPPVSCSAWSDGGGKTTLTLDTLPATWVTPTAADAVYAYGGCVATIAAGALALCDSLGPSRVSGYADPFTSWNDTLSISGLVAIAEEAVDSDGTKMIDEVPVGGVTIDGSAADVEASDVAVGAGPELLYLKNVAVVQA